jgi:hypothetical protein
MRLYSGKIPSIATEVVRTLVAANDIESESPREVEGDIAAVLTQYLGDEREVNDRAKDILERTGKPQSDLSRVRQLVADEKGIKVGDDALDYLLDHVDEVYVEDVELRRKMASIFKKHMAADSKVDAEVRAQLKHVKEGTRQWEIEYARVLDQVRRIKGL